MEETAGANAIVGADVGRVEAEPEGGAAVMRIGEPGAATQHPRSVKSRHGVTSRGRQTTRNPMVWLARSGRPCSR